MESNFNVDFPKSRAFVPPGIATECAIKLSKGLEELIGQNVMDDDPTLIGVGLFQVNPADGSLTCWDPKAKENLAVNNAMDGDYELDCSKYHELARQYCATLVGDSGVLDYLKSKSKDLSEFNVIVHLHYYRNRQKPDQGFHKDTRGQTLFFMLHYLSALPLYGAEWMWEQRLRRVEIQDSRIGSLVYNDKTKESRFWPSGSPWSEKNPPEGWRYVERDSPIDVEGVWPRTICEDVRREKQSGSNDDKIHAFRVSAYGAVLVVDDVVHHRTPHPESRLDWEDDDEGYSQAGFLQARDAHHKRFMYEIERGRSRERTKDGSRGRSRSRSMSNERRKKDSDSDTKNRWTETFNQNPRQFFRVWVTVSHKTTEVWY
jgi:hypothetical protein